MLKKLAIIEDKIDETYPTPPYHLCQNIASRLTGLFHTIGLCNIDKNDNSITSKSSIKLNFHDDILGGITFEHPIRTKEGIDFIKFNCRGENILLTYGNERIPPKTVVNNFYTFNEQTYENTLLLNIKNQSNFFKLQLKSLITMIACYLMLHDGYSSSNKHRVYPEIKCSTYAIPTNWIYISTLKRAKKYVEFLREFDDE
ncbi:hypothetical protein [Proteus mirabilis]|uniref:hypothetical protein n=1 Tax=Proteus mirabilis TaxID=584 RepID=UPI0034D608DF